MRDLDLELDKLMNTQGKYYMAYGVPYNAEEPNTTHILRERRAAEFKKYLVRVCNKKNA
jgi:hypothetical protein